MGEVSRRVIRERRGGNGKDEVERTGMKTGRVSKTMTKDLLGTKLRPIVRLGIDFRVSSINASEVVVYVEGVYKRLGCFCYGCAVSGQIGARGKERGKARGDRH